MTARAEPACWAWPEPASDAMRLLRERWAREAPTASADMGEAEWFYWLMVEWQDYRCAICGRSGLALVMDHDHDTLLNRGFLCISCNTAEGRSDAERFVKYRQKNPATICGYDEKYVDRYEGRNAGP